MIAGDANVSVDKIIDEMPQPGKDNKVLGFCFLDPFQMQNLHFSTIRSLSRRFMDFLVLIPSSMDANRNERHYVSSRNKTLRILLAVPDWRFVGIKKSRPVSHSNTLSLRSLGAQCKRLDT